jgi:hypothetical protein
MQDAFNALTKSLKSTTSLSTDFIRPTEIERRMGRLMRAPDHDAGGGDGGADAGADAGADKGAADAGADGGDDKSLVGAIGDDDADAGADEGDKGADADADKGNEAEKSEADEKGDDEGDGLPEKYTITLPEGYSDLDENLLAEADPLFRELGLGQEQVDKLTPLVPKIQEAVQKKFVDRHEKLGVAWAKASKSAPDLGGDNWKNTESFVAKSLDLAATKLAPAPQLDPAGEPVLDAKGKAVMLDGKEQIKEFRALLDGTKLGNHPTLVRVLRFFGQGISEDSDFIRADGGAQVKKGREEIRYPQNVNGGKE